MANIDWTKSLKYNGVALDHFVRKISTVFLLRLKAGNSKSNCTNGSYLESVLSCKIMRYSACYKGIILEFYIGWSCHELRQEHVHVDSNVHEYVCARVCVRACACGGVWLEHSAVSWWHLEARWLHAAFILYQLITRNRWRLHNGL